MALHARDVARRTPCRLQAPFVACLTRYSSRSMNARRMGWDSMRSGDLSPRGHVVKSCLTLRYEVCPSTRKTRGPEESNVRSPVFEEPRKHSIFARAPVAFSKAN